LEVRFEIKKIKQKQYKSSILYSLTSKKNITIQIKIPTSKNQLLIASKKLRSIKREFIQKKESPIIDKKIIEPIKEIIESDDIIQKPANHPYQPADPPKIENLSKLEDYLYYNFSRKMLYNSVDSPQKFLLEQFPQKQITIENNSIEIAGDSFQGLGNSIFINIEYIENGIDFNTDFSYDFYNKNLVFNNFTLINNGLNKNKLLDLAPTISRLLYLHRSLGTDLVHFLTRHNQVQTKVIINHKGGKKQVVKDSYSRVLLSLNEYFKGKDVYFNFNEVTKIKGHIEILGYLVAKGENSLETADIRIHLNNKNKADLVMIFFYPNVIE
ncbi:MAG: hypothetical protein U9N34_07230, partial [Candidatus Cloacimonadota bacterium]|nr:hypothetical protein [Candidatus Cloacimonadota bacterium]